MKTIRVLLLIASVLFLLVNWLAFHDIAEAHTVRDWLTLLASGLVWFATLRIWLGSAGPVRPKPAGKPFVA